MVKPRRQHRAVSPVIATLLLILIAISAGVVVYAYVVGFIGTATKGTSPGGGALSVEALDIRRTATNATITIYLRNVGGVPISLSLATVFIQLPDGTELSTTAIAAAPNFVTSINPGGTTSGDYLVTSSNINAGQVYSVRVIADDGTTAVHSTKAHS